MLRNVSQYSFPGFNRRAFSFIQKPPTTKEYDRASVNMNSVVLYHVFGSRNTGAFTYHHLYTICLDFGERNPALAEMVN